jgi:superfamily I DNA/RNA helicase
LADKTECIEALCDGLDRADQVVSRIQVLFQDVNKTTADITSYVLLSSVHRAKGLEAKVVRIIRPELLPHPMARLPWQKEQEMNLKYVAETRSLEVLHLHD